MLQNKHLMMETSVLDDVMCIEVEIKSVAEPEAQQCLPIKSCLEKQVKRKNYDNVRESTQKKYRSCELNKETLNCDSSAIPCGGSKNPTKKSKHNYKLKNNNELIDPAELKNVLEGMNDEIDNVLEETAQKNRLTATNVKNILRHVITNEYVLAMVRNTMKAENGEGDDLEEAVFEPKLTRSKVKELREKQHILPWPLSTPVKQAEHETKALLEEEFSDGSSSDEDYKPNEEECPSEEDIVASSPKSVDVDLRVNEKPVSTVQKPEEDGDDDDGLVIVLPESEQDLNNLLVDIEVDKIALRTRSKLPLNDTPLEAIEASFVAPDITVDMYDTHCDDEEWQNFLRELSQPLDANTAFEKPGEEVDDAEEDPEYNALEDDDIPDELDFRFDEVTRKELNALMAEFHEFDQPSFNEGDEDEEENEVPVRNETPVSEVECVRTQWMTQEERMQLEEQMRMYVQLLTQTYLLSCGNPELNFINISSKLFMDEIKMFAQHSSSVNGQSAFHAHNLDGALDIINEYENNRHKLNIRQKSLNKRQVLVPGIPSQFKNTLLESKVFIYPELLPVCGFRKDPETKKTCFLPAEDNLIALGLEEFSFSPAPVNYIKRFLVPSKTEEQIKIRIKNSKTKGTLENPIKYYFSNKRTPPLQRTIRAFDPNSVKAPKDQPLEILPKWMKASLSPITTLPILPKPCKPTVSISKIKALSSKRRFRPLLPRNVQFSPLKQISPILKKYNQKRLMASPGSSTIAAPKTVHFAKKIAIRMPSMSPNPARNREAGTIMENNNVQSSINKSENPPKNINLNYADDSENSKSTCSGTYLMRGQILKTPECVPDLNASECDGTVDLEVTDEGDEEMIDDEPESSVQHDPALTSNIIGKKHSASKKKNKQQRDLESSLALLQPNLMENDPKREERETLFANSYLFRVTEALKGDPDKCDKFLKVLCKHQYNAQSPVKLFYEIKEILKDFPELVDDFVGFLSPEQARECGKFKEYVILSKIRTFIRKVEVHFQNLPQHVLKILRTFTQFRQQSSITSSEVLSVLQPLLKNQSHLMEELMNLLPDIAPCENLMTDIEEVTIPNSDDDNSSVDSCEEIVIPEQVDLYGGKNCQCDCHMSSTETKVLNKIRHCVKCGVKFMDGRVYIQTGKVLKPAQVLYIDPPPEPVPISNGDLKAATKSKSPTSSSSIKHSVTSDQVSKQEALQTKKDSVKAPTHSQLPIVHSDDSFPSTSNLPSDVIEGTVFPAVPVVSKEKNVPSDFSHLKDVIELSNDKDYNPSEKSYLRNNPLNKTTEPKEGANLSSTKAVPETKEWSREEDKLIIYNCQRFGMTEKSFKMSSVTLKTKKEEEVQERFIHLMNLLSKEFNL